MITREQVLHVARLARIELSEAELSTLSGHLASILDYVATLEKVDTSKVSPTAAILPLQNVSRSDEQGKSLTLPEVLAGAPDSSRDCFLVPRILEE